MHGRLGLGLWADAASCLWADQRLGLAHWLPPLAKHVRAQIDSIDQISGGGLAWHARHTSRFLLT
jgi:hypothetical protein